MSQLPKLTKELKSHTNKPQASILQRFFKTGSGEYGAGDVFLGLKVPLQRRIASQYTDLGFDDIKKLLDSKIHEFRMVGLFILVDQYQKAKDQAARAKIVKFYLQNSGRVNNWDLVDLSVYKILGDFLVRAKAAGKKELVNQTFNKLISSSNIWEKRMAMVATFAFLKQKDTEYTFKNAKRLLNDTHDLIHKAVGWMLREAGKRGGEKELKIFLDIHHQKMPRTALRYALEKFKAQDREHYLSKS
jgi:3-methyladenine DNA glycosylase AlkD